MLETFDINKLRGLVDTENLDFDKEYVIGYTELGKNPIKYKVMYTKTSSYLGLEEFVILKNDLTELKLCFNAERSDYIEKILILNEGEILAVATYNAVGDTGQFIYMYDYKLNPLKNSDGDEIIGYEHHYGLDIVNDKLVFYSNDYNTNEKVTYQVEIEKDANLDTYSYHLIENNRTADEFNAGAGRT